MTDGQDSTSTLLRSALPWIDGALANHGIQRTGKPEEPRVRTWATVISIPTERGRAWFKAASSVTAHEIGLYPLLVSTAPDLVLHPYATDPHRAWMLLPDGGTSLRHAVTGNDLVERLVTVMPSYAGLQRALMPRVSELLDLGVPDMHPASLPRYFDEAFAVAETLARSTGADNINAIGQVAALRPQFLRWIEMLNASAVGPSIDHSDLHPNNILLPEGTVGTGRVYDWGDSVVAHPFSTLLVMLRTLMDQLEATPGDPRLDRVRDAYLEPFTDFAPYAELVRLADAACWTSVVIRAMTWIRVLELGSPPDPSWSTAPIAWMKTFLNETWLD